jgi:methionine-S-sulfoxide reductase
MSEAQSSQKEVTTLGGGCFWCLEAVYDDLIGVESVVSGYAGGHVPNPTYEQVCAKKTGHAEVVQVTFDPALITFREILQVFFTIHDPTTLIVRATMWVRSTAPPSFITTKRKRKRPLPLWQS